LSSEQVILPTLLCTIRIWTLHSQSVETPRQTVHNVTDLSEHPHATRPTLNVLTQPAERGKVDAAVRLWAPIDLVPVERTFQVLVEPHKRVERPVAQQTLICIPVPRAVSRPRHCGRGRLIVAHGPREQPVRVGDVIVRVGAYDETVELLTGHAGRARARLEVENERGVRDEGLVAAAAGAAHVSRSMKP